MQDTVSRVDGFASLPLNLSSAPFAGRFEPGCGRKKTRQIIILLSTGTCVLTESRKSLGTEHVKLREPRVSTNRQIILIRVEKVVQVVYRHHQICLVDETGGGHSVMSSPPLSICTVILIVIFNRF